MERVFVCSPFQGKKENIDKVKTYCLQIVNEGKLPIAPHLYFPQFLMEHSQFERAIGISLGCELLLHCDCLQIFGDQITDGMKQEIRFASENGIPIYFGESINEK